MIFSTLLFMTGLAILWFSSEMVIRSIGPIARHFKIKELVVTILGVSVLSSLPELSVSAFSALAGNADISIGNVVGSNFVTLTFVTALCALIAPIAIKMEIKDRESSWMVLSSVLILLFAIDGEVSRVDGILLIVLYIPYIISVIKEAQADTSEINHDEPGKKSWPVWLAFIIMIIAIGGVILGADIALKHGQVLGEKMGIPALAMGAILFAFGTSLPELAIAVSATLKKKADVSIGEVYASNIFTAMVVLGICAVIMPLKITDHALITFDIPMLIFAGVVLQIFITTGMKLTRFEALAVMGIYVVFVLQHVLPGGIPLKF